jgi:predicted secreted protein
MSIFSAFVVFAMIWALVFLIGLQVGQDTQGDRGDVTRGTHASTPAKPIGVYRRMGWATVITLLIWGPLIWVIVSGVLTIDDLRWLTGREQLGE